LDSHGRRLDRLGQAGEPDPASRSFGGVLDTDRFANAVWRLLDLKLIEARPDPKNGMLHYGYFWTYLGVEGLAKLQFRARPAQEIRK
jgi:hypothetical protein